MRPDWNRRWDFRQYRDQIGPDSDIYMRRRHVGAVRVSHWLLQLRVHHIHREDKDPNPHTHPFGFWSWIWRGSYVENIYNAEGKRLRERWRRRWSLAWSPRDRVHNVIHLGRDRPVTTVVLCVFDARDPNPAWGFVENGKWIESQVYLSRPKNRDRRVLGDPNV